MTKDGREGRKEGKREGVGGGIEKHWFSLLYRVKLSVDLQSIGSTYSYLKQVKVVGEVVYSVEWRTRLG